MAAGQNPKYGLQPLGGGGFEGYNGAGTPNLNLSINSATSTEGGYANQDRSQLEDQLAGGQSALNKYAQSAMSSAMPGLYSALQGQRESNVRRGVSTGDLGTSYEGDIYSSFQRNLSNAIGQQSMNLYGTQLGAEQNLNQMDTSNYNDMMYANRDYQTGRDNAKRQRNSNLWGGIMGAVGGAAGALVPGLGPTAGSKIGSAAGAALGG